MSENQKPINTFEREVLADAPPFHYKYYVPVALSNGEFGAGFYETNHSIETEDDVQAMVSKLAERFGDAGLVPINWKLVC